MNTNGYISASRRGMEMCDGAGTKPLQFIKRPECPLEHSGQKVYALRQGNDSTDQLTAAQAAEKPQTIFLGQSEPNPGKDRISIPYFLPEHSEQAEIRVIEVNSGRLVGVYPITNSGKGKVDIDLGEFRNGVYAYRLIPKAGKAPGTLKFIVMR
jgi:hypothetical protein